MGKKFQGILYDSRLDLLHYYKEFLDMVGDEVCYLVLPKSRKKNEGAPGKAFYKGRRQILLSLRLVT